MGDLNQTIQDGILIFGLVFALLHFLLAVVLYRELLRINSVFKSENSGFIVILATFYLITMGIILIFFITISGVI